VSSIQSLRGRTYKLKRVEITKENIIFDYITFQNFSIWKSCLNTILWKQQMSYLKYDRVWILSSNCDAMLSHFSRVRLCATPETGYVPMLRAVTDGQRFGLGMQQKNKNGAILISFSVHLSIFLPSALCLFKFLWKPCPAGFSSSFLLFP